MVEENPPEPFGVWVYAVTGDLPEGHLTDVTGVGGAAVHPVRQAGLVAVVSRVSLAEFGEEPLRRNLEDLAWLEATARAHHGVVDALAAAGPTVAMRLATVYRDDSRVAAMLAERREQLRAALRQIAGRTEFGVKAYAVVTAPPDATAESAGRSGSATGPGTAYLLRRRAELATRDRQLDAAMTDADTVHTALSGLAEAARRYVPQHPSLTGESASMVLNGAYLVDADRVDEFVAAVRALDDQHRTVRLELTGPWPPYSFAAAAEPS
jgi:hypothetical protein